MRHFTNSAVADFAYDFQNEELKVLVWHKHFAVNASNETVTSELLLHNNNDSIMNNENIDQDRNNNINIEDATLNSAS